LGFSERVSEKMQEVAWSGTVLLQEEVSNTKQKNALIRKPRGGPDTGLLKHGASQS